VRHCCRPSGSILSNHTIKDTAIAAVIAVARIHETLREDGGGGKSFHPVEVFTVAAPRLFRDPLSRLTRLVDIVYGRLCPISADP